MHLSFIERIPTLQNRKVLQDFPSMGVVGEDGPNKGKRYPAICRFIGRDLEICYDLSEKDRPTEFQSREGAMLFRVTYYRK